METIVETALMKTNEEGSSTRSNEDKEDDKGEKEPQVTEIRGVVFGGDLEVLTDVAF